jgi:hypothetical protein
VEQRHTQELLKPPRASARTEKERTEKFINFDCVMMSMDADLNLTASMIEDVAVALREFACDFLRNEEVNLDNMNPKKRVKTIEDVQDAWRDIFYELERQEHEEQELLQQNAAWKQCGPYGTKNYSVVNMK